MENQEIIKKLNSLVHLDIDAVQAYTTAIEKIDIEDVKSKLTGFRGDHQRHIEELSVAIRKLGAEPPERKPDMKGFFIQGFTALRSVTGNEGALKAMDTNEKLTNTTYEKALGWDMPADVKDIIRRGREDERRHLAYIEEQIQNRVWERHARAA